MSDLKNLNLNVEEESKEANKFETLPPGEYAVIISQSEMKDNKSGNGCHLSITLEVIEGDRQGRLLWHNFNVQNANPTAEKIGRAELAALCKAVGVLNPKDSNDLHDKPLVVKVGMDKKDPTRNDIKSFVCKDAVSTFAPVPPPVAAKASAPVAGKKPWAK